MLEEGQRSLPVAVYMFAAHTVAAVRTRPAVEVRRNAAVAEHTAAVAEHRLSALRKLALGRTRRSVARRRFGLGQHTVEQRRPARRPAQHTSALEELRTSSSAVPYRRWC